jgi:hypothetical protein
MANCSSPNDLSDDDISSLWSPFQTDQQTRLMCEDLRGEAQVRLRSATVAEKTLFAMETTATRLAGERKAT